MPKDCNRRLADVYSAQRDVGGMSVTKCQVLPYNNRICRAHPSKPMSMQATAVPQQDSA